MEKLFLLILAGLLSLSNGDCNTCCAKSAGIARPQIDYVQLTVQNAKGYCNLHNCDASNFNGWTIHGLWPSQKGQMGPNSCNSSAHFDESALTDLTQKMNQEWPTLYGGDSTSFWSHEWCKHGTCAMNAPSMTTIDSMIAYFTTALTMFETLNIDSSLSSAGVTHSNEYNLAKFNVFDKLPAFECTRKGDSQVLFQARFCFTTDLEAVDCDMDWFASIQPCDESIVVNYL